MSVVGELTGKLSVVLGAIDGVRAVVDYRDAEMLIPVLEAMRNDMLVNPQRYGDDDPKLMAAHTDACIDMLAAFVTMAKKADQMNVVGSSLGMPRVPADMADLIDEAAERAKRATINRLKDLWGERK